jgi:hypothetical protein
MIVVVPSDMRATKSLGVALALLLIVGCGAKNSDMGPSDTERGAEAGPTENLENAIESLDDAARDFQNRQSQTLLAAMPLKAMFPDARLRTLASAAGKGDLQAIDRLVNEGVNVNGRGTQDATVLFWAIRMRNTAGFTRLLERGADPNVIYGDGGSIMHWATISDDPEFLRVALRHGGNPNLKAGEFGQTPLMDSVIYNQDALEVLLEAGADLDVQDDNGNTAVMVAAGLKRFDTTYLLLSRGADYSISNRYGKTIADRMARSRGRIPEDRESLIRQRERVVHWLRDHGVAVE